MRWKALNFLFSKHVFFLKSTNGDRRNLDLKIFNRISLYKNQRELSLKLEKSMILTGPILRSLFKSHVFQQCSFFKPDQGYPSISLKLLQFTSLCVTVNNFCKIRSIGKGKLPDFFFQNDKKYSLFMDLRQFKVGVLAHFCLIFNDFH